MYGEFCDIYSPRAEKLTQFQNSHNVVEKEELKSESLFEFLSNVQNLDKIEDVINSIDENTTKALLKKFIESRI